MVRGQKSPINKTLWPHISQQMHQGEIITLESTWKQALNSFVQADSLEGEKENQLKAVEKNGGAGGEGEYRKDLRTKLCGV